jgi:hypothetical protein
MGTQRRELARSASKWQEAQLNTFAKRPFAELALMPQRTKLETPPHLKGLRLAVERRAGSNGGIEISVKRIWRSFLIFEGSVGPSFEMLPDGRILYPDTSADDDD